MAGITKWYVVHTYSGYENKVQDNIKKVVDNRNMNDQILDVRVPSDPRRSRPHGAHRGGQG